MTIDRKDIVTIPKWLVIIITPIILGAIGGIVTSSFNIGKHVKQIEINTEAIKTKADKETYYLTIKDIKESVVRIETKLDIHIAK